MQTATLHCYGGTGEVTGANFVLDTGTARIMIDCGLIQGEAFAVKRNCDTFAYDPHTITALLITHAHADHIGRIPKLIAEGFRGTIYSTVATRELAREMLKDALMVMRLEAEHTGVEPCYNEADMLNAFTRWEGVSYGDSTALPDGVTAHWHTAGHILGSAIITLEREGKRFVFTGDIGNIPQPLLDPPEVPHDYDYLLMESVYGNRAHEGVATRTERLRAVIEEARAKGGTLIIPAFSLERTQAMLMEINRFVEDEGMEPLPVYLDSPLAIRVTELYRTQSSYLSKTMQERIARGDDIFSFPSLHISATKEESEAIHRVSGAKIIIAGSGMSHGGRILSHERWYLDDASTILLLVGYQGVGTVGRMLRDGAREVRVQGKKVEVRATIRTIDGYSGHADRDQLVHFVEQGLSPRTKKIFVVMGEDSAALFLTQRLRDFLNAPALAPKEGDSFTVEF